MVNPSLQLHACRNQHNSGRRQTQVSLPPRWKWGPLHSGRLGQQGELCTATKPLLALVPIMNGRLSGPANLDWFISLTFTSGTNQYASKPNAREVGARLCFCQLAKARFPLAQNIWGSPAFWLIYTSMALFGPRTSKHFVSIYSFNNPHRHPRAGGKQEISREAAICPVKEHTGAVKPPRLYSASIPDFLRDTGQIA